MAKFIKGFSLRCAILLALVAILFCAYIALNNDIAYAMNDGMPQDTLLVKGAKEDASWEYGYNSLTEWNAYTLGTPVDRLGDYNPDNNNGKILAWTTTIEEFKKCGILTKVSITKTEDGTEVASCVASDPEIGIQKEDCPVVNSSGTRMNRIWPGGEQAHYSNYNGVIMNNMVINPDGATMTSRPYVREGNDFPSKYVAIQGTVAQIIADTNYDFTVILYFNGSENAPAIPEEVQAVIDAISAIGDVDENNYTDKEKLVTAAKTAYDALESQDLKDQVTNYDTLTAAEASIASFKLAAAKTKAKGELDTLLAGKNEADYDADDWTALTKAISDGKDAIDAATTIDGVDAAKTAAENAVSAIKTKKQKAAEEIKKQKAAAKKYKVAGLKVTSKNRKFTISWGKTKGATGYQVQYRLKGSKKFKTLKSLTKTKMISKKLKLNKKYQFRVRTYTKVDGTKIFGVWTKVKTVKCRGRK